MYVGAGRCPTLPRAAPTARRRVSREYTDLKSGCGGDDDDAAVRVVSPGRTRLLCPPRLRDDDRRGDVRRCGGAQSGAPPRSTRHAGATRRVADQRQPCSGPEAGARTLLLIARAHWQPAFARFDGPRSLRPLPRRLAPRPPRRAVQRRGHWALLHRHHPQLLSLGHPGACWRNCACTSTHPLQITQTCACTDPAPARH